MAEGGCHFAQGFIFKEPVDGKQAAEIIRGNQVWLPEILTPAPALAGRLPGQTPLTSVS